MFNDYFDRMSHVHRLLNVNQFVKDTSQVPGGGTISTTSGAPATSGVMLGGAQGIKTQYHNDGELTTPKVLGMMKDYKSKGVELLGSWNPEPSSDIPPEKQGIQIDAVSRHTRENVGEAFKERTQEHSAYDIDKGEEIRNPYYKGE